MASSPPPQVPGAPGAPAAKKGLSTLQWVLIVLGTLFVLMTGACVACGLAVNSFVGRVASEFEENPAKAAAEMAVRLNPDLELVSTDDAAGTMTIRNRENGEEITVDFSDVSSGNLSFSTDQGDMTISADEGGLTATGPDGQVATFGAGANVQVAEWVERYPGAAVAETGFASTSAEQISGLFSMVTDDSVDDVTAWYRERLESLGYEVQVTTTSGAQGASSMIIATLADVERNQSVVVNAQDGRTQIAIQYSGRP